MLSSTAVRVWLKAAELLDSSRGFTVAVLSEIVVALYISETVTVSSSKKSRSTSPTGKKVSTD